MVQGGASRSTRKQFVGWAAPLHIVAGVHNHEEVLAWHGLSKYHRVRISSTACSRAIAVGPGVVQTKHGGGRGAAE